MTESPAIASAYTQHPMSSILRAGRPRSWISHIGKYARVISQSQRIIGSPQDTNSSVATVHNQLNALSQLRSLPPPPPLL